MQTFSKAEFAAKAEVAAVDFGQAVICDEQHQR
jgi:hypothetical protein